MGFEFLEEVGEKLKAAGLDDVAEVEAALAERVTDLGLDVEDLDIEWEGGTATVFGIAADDETREKVILAVGNSVGVTSVEDEMEVGETADERERLQAEALERAEAHRKELIEAREAAQAEAERAEAGEKEREALIAAREREARKKHRKERKAARRKRKRREKRQESTFYTVVSGDTLSKIAAAHYGDGSKWPTIFEANTPMLTNPDLIYPGQVLRIPPQED